MIDRRSLAVVLLLLLPAAIAVAQESHYVPLQPLPLGATLLTLPSPHVSAAGTWEARFNHRFGEAGRDVIHTLFGLDAGANVGMGLAYVPFRDLEIALMRTNVLDTIELSAKYVVVQQAPAIPLSVSLRGGVDWRTERNIDDRSSLFVQGIVARRITPRLEVFLLPTVASEAGRAATEDGSVAAFEYAANLPVGAALLLGQGLTAVIELIPANRDLPRSATSELAWALGIKKAIGGHHFELVATNSPAITTDQYVTSTHLGAPLELGDIHFGFNIERQFGRRR